HDRGRERPLGGQQVEPGGVDGAVPAGRSGRGWGRHRPRLPQATRTASRADAPADPFRGPAPGPPAPTVADAPRRRIPRNRPPRTPWDPTTDRPTTTRATATAPPSWCARAPPGCST